MQRPDEDKDAHAARLAPSFIFKRLGPWYIEDASGAENKGGEAQDNQAAAQQAAPSIGRTADDSTGCRRLLAADAGDEPEDKQPAKSAPGSVRPEQDPVSGINAVDGTTEQGSDPVDAVGRSALSEALANVSDAVRLIGK